MKNEIMTTCTEFLDYLKSKEYDEKSLYVSNYNIPKCPDSTCYKRIEVRDNGRVVQAFILMPEEDRKTYMKYSFYRVYNQYASKNENVRPACYVVSKNSENIWEVYNCNCLDLKMDENSYNRIINYKEAKKSFYRRWYSVPSVKMIRELRMLTIAFSIIGILLILFHKAIGLSSEALKIIGIMTPIFAIIATVAPCLNSIKIFGNAICLSTEDDYVKKL